MCYDYYHHTKQHDSDTVVERYNGEEQHRITLQKMDKWTTLCGACSQNSVQICLRILTLWSKEKHSLTDNT